MPKHNLVLLQSGSILQSKESQSIEIKSQAMQSKQTPSQTNRNHARRSNANYRLSSLALQPVQSTSIPPGISFGKI